MSLTISQIRDGSDETRQVDTGTTGLDLFGDDRSIVAMKVNGETRDLAHALANGDEIAPVEVTSDEGLSILRHSCAMSPRRPCKSARRGQVGTPAHHRGFYYDFKSTMPSLPSS